MYDAFSGSLFVYIAISVLWRCVHLHSQHLTHMGSKLPHHHEMIGPFNKMPYLSKWNCKALFMFTICTLPQVNSGGRHVALLGNFAICTNLSSTLLVVPCVCIQFTVSMHTTCTNFTYRELYKRNEEKASLEWSMASYFTTLQYVRSLFEYYAQGVLHPAWLCALKEGFRHLLLLLS